jgi:hypothetical protein
MSAPASSRWDNEARLLAVLAVCVSVFTFLYYFRHGDILLYGDAVAHINIARRVFDSKTPGLLQLGTVWLPLPHLLILPFVFSGSLWQNGAGGSLPCMVAYVLGVVGIFRLARNISPHRDTTGARIGAWSAALIYGANPNLIYMQATAMGEAVYLALFIWVVVHFMEYARGEDKALAKCGWCLFAASLTRYDGWFLAVLVVLGVVALGRGRIVAPRPQSADNVSKRRVFPQEPGFRKTMLRFLLVAAAGPVLWLGYNAIVYRNPLEFANGPYSAKAIEQETRTVNPAQGSLLAAGSYFLKAAELNMADIPWQGKLWLALALLGSLVAWSSGPGRAALLLWAPLPFYALSLAYGSVPIFVPGWWPFSHYNVRYGLQLLPAFAIFAPLAIGFAVKIGAFVSPQKRSIKGILWINPAALALVLIAVTASYVSIWRAGPVCYREASINSRGRIALEAQLSSLLLKLPPQATLLMYLGQHVGALERAGIPLRRVINESNHRVWKEPTDPEGLWERALADPEAYADYVVAFEGDRVWQAVQARHLSALVEIHSLGEPPAIIYLGRTSRPTQ